MERGERLLIIVMGVSPHHLRIVLGWAGVKVIDETNLYWNSFINIC